MESTKKLSGADNSTIAIKGAKDAHGFNEKPDKFSDTIFGHKKELLSVCELINVTEEII